MPQHHSTSLPPSHAIGSPRLTLSQQIRLHAHEVESLSCFSNGNTTAPNASTRNSDPHAVADDDFSPVIIGSCRISTDAAAAGM